MGMPENIGPYRILGLLGEGSSGVVYRAERMEDRQGAALKTVRVPQAALIEGLRREIHALARLWHPDIVHILDQGLHEGVPWYAMELMEGQSLRRRLGEERLPLQDALSLVRRLCAPLGFLHGEGFVHRDLKPENVLLRPDGSPMLLDFGIAARFTGQVSRETLEIAEGLSGTLAYMAPEQIRGELTDARADLYSLGCILYELITGRVPFQGTTLAQLVRQHLSQEPVVPSKLVDGLDPRLDALVLRLLAKSPQERFGHAGAVAAALAEPEAEEGPEAARPVPRAFLYRPRLAGREAVLSELEGHLTRLVQGIGGAVFLSGESGAGKTRLLLELARRARRYPIRVLSGEALPLTGSGSEQAPRGGGPLHPLRGLLRAIADRCREHGPAETERLLGAHGKVLAHWEPALAGLPGQEAHPEPAELPPQAALIRLYRFLAELLAAFVGAGTERTAPLALLLDDLQWADEVTLGLLPFLLHSRRLQAMPLLLVAAYRVEEVDPRKDREGGLQGLLEAPEARRIELERLDETAIGAMVGDMLALTPSPALFVRHLTRCSEGNPFFVAEYLRTAVGEGLLYRDEAGRWQVAEKAESAAAEALYEALPLPRSLRELIGQRLERLSVRARQLVEIASVLGRETEQGLLAAVARMGEEPLMESLHELLTRQVLEEAGAGRWRFVHDQIREAAYAGIGAGLRRELHRVAAEVLEGRAGPGLDEHKGLVGHHWEQAGEPARARERYLEAARHARSRYAHGESERFYRAHLRLVQEPTSDSAQARIELGWSVLQSQGRIREAIVEIHRAVDEARGLQTRQAETVSLNHLGYLLWQSGQIEESRAVLESALALAREIGSDRDAGRSLATLAVLHLRQGRLEEARPLFQRALAIADELDDWRWKARILVNFAGLYNVQGDSEQARTLWEQCLELSRRAGDRETESAALGGLAGLASAQGRLEQALALDSQALAVARDIGNKLREAGALCNLAELNGQLGRMESVDALYSEGLAILREIGNLRVEGVHSLYKARLDRQRGRLEEAGQGLDAAERLLEEVGDRFFVSLVHGERGQLALAGGRSGRPELDRVERAAVELGAVRECELGQAVARLRRAVEAFEAGRPLFRGQLVEDLPAGLRRALVRSGQLAPEALA